MHRLFEIIYLLLRNGSMSARELAEHFEVSQRTIYRDVERLSQSGVPIYMERGPKGGISLLENFQMDRAYLTAEEQETLLASLETLAPLATQAEQNLLTKIAAQFGRPAANWLIIDPDPWGENSAGHFDQLRQSILAKQVISFDYLGRSASSEGRLVEPYQLYFKGQNWYLIGFDLTKQGWRLFKLPRMRNLQMEDRTFEPRQVPNLTQSMDDQEATKIVFLLKGAAVNRGLENFPASQTRYLADGRLEITVFWPMDEWVVGHLLSYGVNVEVVEPRELRDELKGTIAKMNEIY